MAPQIRPQVCARLRGALSNACGKEVVADHVAQLVERPARRQNSSRKVLR